MSMSMRKFEVKLMKCKTKKGQAEVRLIYLLMPLPLQGESG